MRERPASVISASPIVHCTQIERRHSGALSGRIRSPANPGLKPWAVLFGHFMAQAKADLPTCLALAWPLTFHLSLLTSHFCLVATFCAPDSSPSS